jgi:hypothetical protein
MIEAEVYLLREEIKNLRKEFQTFKKIMLSIHDISVMQYLHLKTNVEEEQNNA